MIRRSVVSFLAAYAVFALAAVSGLYGIGEKTVTIGAGSGWEAVENRYGVSELPLVRPQPVLALTPSSFQRTDAVDFSLSFDERNPNSIRDGAGRWQITAASTIEFVDSSLARSGSGAVRFTAGIIPVNDRGAGSIIARPGRNSLFSPGRRMGDFSIEFWLLPLNLENGEQIINWSSSRNDNRGGYIVQRIQCTISKNRLSWDFIDFFTDPAGNNRIDISFSGSRIMPRDWSHHLIRFDSDTGLFEYLVDGRLEAVDYVTTTRREGGEVYTPLAGENGSLILGGSFSGLMDEFRIYGGLLENPALTRFPNEGRAQTRSLDLGSVMSRVLKIEVSGGRTNGSGWNTMNSYAGSGNMRFSDHSEIQLFARMSNNPYLWDDAPWIPIRPGEELPPDYVGRYLQVAADFYSSGNGEVTPYLDELRIIYKGADMPRPPSLVSAAAADGAVELSWRESVSSNAGGYLVFFGTSPGEYFGTAVVGMAEARSPVDAGNQTSIRIEGLRNGIIYYFSIAAYDNIFSETGDFSREVAARPLRGY